MVALNIGVVTKEDLHEPLGLALDLVAIAGLDELTDQRYIHGTHQVRHEDEAVLEHGQTMHGRAPVVMGDLKRQLAHALLELVYGNDHPQVRSFGSLIHKLLSAQGPSQPYRLRYA